MQHRSYQLVTILRHNLTDHDLSMDDAGFVSIDNIRKHPLFMDVTTEMLSGFVDADKKGRFSMIIDHTGVRIRANQGHTAKMAVVLDDSKMHKAIDAVNADLCTVYHATTYTAWAIIKKDGLRPMNRIHVHMAKSIDAKAGIRTTKGVNMIIAIDVKRCIASGIVFYESTNGVILTRYTIDPCMMSIYK